MKKSLSTMLALTLVFPIAALAQGTMKIGTVDMQRAFKEYNKTKEAEVPPRKSTTIERSLTKRRWTRSII
jgi:Skp family chaperone for outer membrane proteins